MVYSCNEGFLLEGGTRQRCAGTVGWMPQGLPKCRTLASISGITCPALDNSDHGTIVVEGFETGQLVTYECDTGFQPAPLRGRQLWSAIRTGPGALATRNPIPTSRSGARKTFAASRKLPPTGPSLSRPAISDRRRSSAATKDSC